uniref:Uncharacterized protein n=1 Tax=Bionectria ochroleuca TaxID=29856 RepID=A0A8H7N442_BIOOC
MLLPAGWNHQLRRAVPSNQDPFHILLWVNWGTWKEKSTVFPDISHDHGDLSKSMASMAPWAMLLRMREIWLIGKGHISRSSSDRGRFFLTLPDDRGSPSKDEGCSINCGCVPRA